LKSIKLKAKKGKPFPMPNAGNARDTILSLTSATGSVALVIGKSVAESSNVSGFGWIELENAKKVLQFFPHTGKARALDTLKPGKKPLFFKGATKNLKPKKYDNKLAGEVAALKLNVEMSDAIFGVTPFGIGDIIFNNGSGDANPLNGKTLQDAVSLVDSALSYYKKFTTSGIFDTLANSLAKVNIEFSGAMDKISIVPRMKIKGVKDISQVSYLHFSYGEKQMQRSFQHNGQMTNNIPEKISLSQKFSEPV